MTAPRADVPDRKPVKLAADVALSLLTKGKYVHCFGNPGGMLVGVDWDRASVEELFRGSERIELAGDIATSTGHGVVAFDGPRRPLFFATDAKALATFVKDLGEEKR